MSATQATEESTPKSRSTIRTLIDHPVGFWFIFWGELAERCSFYGMMAILPRFISEEDPIRGGLYLGDANSNTWVSMFKAAAYVLPLAGGFLADQFFGKYRLIVLFSIPYILGHFLMSYETVPWTMFALSLLALGSGIIKPNISTLMGMTYDQKRPGDDALRSMAFGMFYMAINIGAALSYFFLPMIRDQYNYAVAFMCPAVLMAVSFVIFASGKPFYAVETITRTKATPEETQLKWFTLRRVAGIFLVITFFWAIFDQSHTIWIFFARDFTDLRVFGHEISVEQIGTLNPVLIVLFVPLMPFLWNFLEKFGFRARATDKIMIGFFLTGISMGVMAIAGYMCDSYEDKEVPRPEKAVTKLVFDDANKVTVNVIQGKDDPKKAAEKKKEKQDPAAVVSGSERVVVTVIAETMKKAPKRVVAPRFETDVRTALAVGCVRCHGEKKDADGSMANKQAADLDLRTLAAVMKGGATGPAVIADAPEKSLLLLAHGGLKIKADEGDWISAGQIASIQDWIQKGATSTAQRNVSLWWEVLAFTAITLAEVLISITGLELAFVVAPASMKSFITALWLMTVAIANLFINASVGRLYNSMSPGNYFAMLAGATVVVIVVFYVVARQFNQMSAEQEEATRKAVEAAAAAERAQTKDPA